MPTPYAHTLSTQVNCPEYRFDDVYAVHAFLDLARLGCAGSAHRPLFHNDYGLSLLTSVLPRSPFSRRELLAIGRQHLVEDGLMTLRDGKVPTLTSSLTLTDPLYWRGETQPLSLPTDYTEQSGNDADGEDDADDDLSEEQRLARILGLDEDAQDDDGRQGVLGGTPLHGYSHLVIDVETERHCREDAAKFGGLPDAYRAVHAFMNGAAWYYPSFAHRAVLHHSLGHAVVEMAFGPAIDISSPSVGKLKPVPTRTIVDRHIARDMGRIPALHTALATISGVVRYPRGED